MWKYYALLSALFAVLTAVFAKIGVKDINLDLATAIRTSVILFITWGIGFAGNYTAEVKGISGHTWIFLNSVRYCHSLRIIIGALLITGGSIVMLIK